MRRPLLLAYLLVAAPVVGQLEIPSPGRVLADRVAARVDEAPILASDVDRVLALGMVEPEAGESHDELRARVLEGLIDQHLRLREADRFGAPWVDLAAIDAQVTRLEERFGGPDALAARLAATDLDGAGLRYLIERQLAVLVYIDTYLAPRVFVPTDEVAAYYEGELALEMERRDEPLPPLEDVREPIRLVLRERHLDREIAEWTAELRAEAEIELLPAPGDELPPLRERIGPG